MKRLETAKLLDIIPGQCLVILSNYDTII